MDIPIHFMVCQLSVIMAYISTHIICSIYSTISRICAVQVSYSQVYSCDISLTPHTAHGPARMLTVCLY